MFFQESITFDFVGFMLSFLFEPASSGCQFVLFFTTFTSCSKRHFTNRCHVVYYSAQLLQFFSDRCQFSWISGKIVSIPTPCFSTVKLEQFINSIPCKTNKLLDIKTINSGIFSLPVFYPLKLHISTKYRVHNFI